MVPPKTDPRWRRLVTGTTHYELTGLSTKMMLTRVRLMGARKDEQSQKDAVETAWTFFTKNELTVADDLKTILAGEGHP